MSSLSLVRQAGQRVSGAGRTTGEAPSENDPGTLGGQRQRVKPLSLETPARQRGGKPASNGPSSRFGDQLLHNRYTRAHWL